MLLFDDGSIGRDTNVFIEEEFQSSHVHDLFSILGEDQKSLVIDGDMAILKCL